MDLSANAKLVYPDWWNYVTYAASAKEASGAYSFTTTDLAAAVADISAQAGQTISFNEQAGLASLFGIARGMERAADRLTALPDDGLINQQHISEAPYSRTLAAQNASPMYKLIAEVTYRAPDGSVIQSWATGFFPNVPPRTAGDMRDEARLQFQRMLNKRDEQKNTGGELLAIGRTYLISI